MEPKTDRRTQKRRRNSLILTIIVHSMVFIALFLPLLSRLNLTDIGVAGMGQSEFQIVVDQSAMGINLPELEMPLEKIEEADPSENPMEDSKEEEAPKAKPVKTTDNHRKSKRELVSNPVEESILDAAPKAATSKEKEAGETTPDFSESFGRTAPESGDNGTNLSGPNASLPGMERDALSEGFSVQGMDGRYPVYSPNPDERIRENGTVVVRICVDQYGEVVRAEYTQAGTMASTYLKQLAEATSCKWKFNPGTSSLQCGKIVYHFRVK